MENEENIAEFIGVMLGDGSIGIYDTHARDKIKKHRVVKVTLDSRNKQYTEYVSKLMENVLGFKPTIRFKKNENAVDISTFRKNVFEYVLNDLGLKISPKWNKMEIPKEYTYGKLALIILRGLFDTDGSVTIFNNNGTIYPRIEIRVMPSPAQNQIINILEKNKFNFKIQRLDKGNIKIRISGKKELKNWFEKVGSSNQLYIERAKQFLENKK